MPMTDEQFATRTAELFNQERNAPLRLWYLSFSGEEGWRGGAIVKARGMVGAVSRCNVLGINPGGEVAGIPVPVGVEIEDGLTDRLLSRVELEVSPI